MTWYKTAKSFTDIEKWILHGVYPPDCREEFAPQRKKRKEMQDKAHAQAESLGHILFKGWTTINSNRCRKCSMTVSLPNVIGQTDAPDAIGAAVSERCIVHLDVPDDYFEKSDEYLDRDVPLNRDADDTVI